jgi:cell division protease FtsH
MRIQYARLLAGGLHSKKNRLPVVNDGAECVVKIADFEFRVAPECLAATATLNGVAQVYVTSCDVDWDDDLEIARELIPADRSAKNDKRILFCLDWSPNGGDEQRFKDVDVSLDGFERGQFISASDHVLLMVMKPEQLWRFTRSWSVKENVLGQVEWVHMEQPCGLLHTGREVILQMGPAAEVGRTVAGGKATNKETGSKKEAHMPESTSTALVLVKGGAKKKPVTFDDVIGQEEAKDALRKIVRMLKRFDRLRELDAEMPHGVLLQGDGGNGKTMLAKALATEAGIAFLKVMAASLISPYPGESGKNVSKLFNEARKLKAPVIIFLDEIDAIGAKRTSGSDNRLVDLLNTLLNEMDTLGEGEYPIIVIGATNRPDALDPNLLRAGRFDRKVTVRNPKQDDMVKLVTHYSRNFRLADDVDLEAVAKKIAGLPASSAKNVCNEAALLLFAADETGRLGLKVTQEMFLTAAKQEVREHVGTSKGKRFNVNENSIKLVDVIGQPGAKEDLQDVINYLRNPQAFHEAGAAIPKGMLMVGPPGEGKTRLARAVAGEAEVPFFSIAGSDFVEKYVGVGAARVRELFAEAKRNAPCIVFIDEIDAVGKKRAQGGDGNDEREQTLNQILVEMDGFDPQAEPIVVLAATNRKDVLDPALIRPGRLDREAVFHHPDVDDRLALFQYYTRNKKLATGVKLEFFARNTFGMSAARIESICNEATLLMLREGAKEVTAKHLDAAITRVTVGAARKLGNVTEEDLENTRVHEGGHAVVGWFAGGTKIARITVLPYGESLGHVAYMNDDRHGSTKQQMLDRIARALAGRAATEIVLDTIDTGPSSDFESARTMAYAMVTEYGMSELGPIPAIKGVERSEAEKAAIEAATNSIVKACDERARQLINEHRAELDAVVKALRKRETILGPEFEAMMAGQKARRPRQKVKPLVA